MKINVKALELIEKGLSSNTVSKLTESQIEVLHSKLLNEQPTPIVRTKTVKQIELPSGSETTVGNVSVSNKGGRTTITPTTEEVTEDDEVSLDPNKETETQDSHQVGPSTNDGFNSDDDGMYNFESIEEGKKKSNPWAICTAQLGKEFGTTERHMWSAKEKNKYERCVKDVKQSLKENKNEVSLFLENQIMKIVEKHLPPRITKGDLVKYLSENSPSTAPTTKPAPTKPGTKTPPKPRPAHPGKNPNPGEKESPKAKNISPEKAKEEVIDLIINLLEK